MAKLKKRADGRYCINVYIGSVDGKPKYKSVYGKSPAEVNRKAAEVRVQYLKGVEILSGENTLFSFWAEQFLNKVSLTAEYEWYKLQRTRMKVWTEQFGDANIKNIRTADCDRIIAEIAAHNPYYPDKPTSQRTLTEYKNILSRLFDFCIQNRVLTFNPAKYITVPKDKKKAERLPISNKEIDCFWKVEHKLRTATLIMIYAGLRRGEISALTWADINFERNTITVNKAIDIKGGGEIKTPKTEAGNRVVPMPKLLADYLKQQHKDNLLVLHENGNAYNNTAWAREWKNYLNKIEKETGIGINTTVHCLRHTYCTLLYEAGIDVLTAKSYMGHADINTTMKIYTHLRQEKEQMNISKLDEYLSPASDKDEALS